MVFRFGVNNWGLKKIKINFANFINSIKQDDCQLASRLVFYDEMK
ncbi:Uncharacterised protein [Streptococcus pneumoniae]|nr:Uncharacterised protein [Streptococcus pneumoniae]VNE35864.1 Uncharacterised protein [Streptococcus pneumoniae]